MRMTVSLLTCLCMIGLSQSFSAVAQTKTSKPNIKLTAEEKQLIAEGFTLKMNKGQKVFCKMETELGSRFEMSVCHTASQWQAEQDAARESFDASRRAIVGGMGH